MNATNAMFKLLANALHSEEPAPAPDPPPGSPRLQVEHARRLEEELAILKADLAEQKQKYEKKLQEQQEQHDEKLRSQRTKFEGKTDRLEARNKWLEDTVKQLTEEKSWLGKRNAQLEDTEKRQTTKINKLEDEMFELKTENWNLKQENQDFRLDFDAMAAEMVVMEQHSLQQAQRARQALTRPRAQVQTETSGSAGENSRDVAATAMTTATRTPTQQRIQQARDPLTGDTLVTARSVQRQSVDPRSLEALRTLAPERSGSPTPPARRAIPPASMAAAAAGVSGSENVTVRAGRKRQRTDSDGPGAAVL